MPLTLCPPTDDCVKLITNAMRDEIVTFKGLNANGCFRYEDAVDLVARLETPFAATGMNGIAITPGGPNGHQPTIAFNDCLWSVDTGEIDSLIGQVMDGCKVRESIASFIERTETLLVFDSPQGTIASTQTGTADHSFSADVRVAADQGAGTNQIAIIPGINGGLYVPPTAVTTTAPLTGDGRTEPLDIDFSMLGPADLCAMGNVITAGTAVKALGKDADGCIVEALFADIVGGTQTPLETVDSDTIAFATFGTADHTLTGDVKISGTPGNVITSELDGLFVDGEAANVPLNRVNTPTIAITLAGTANHTIEADVVIDPAGDNILLATADGLYVPTPPVAAVEIDSVTDCNSLENTAGPGGGLYVHVPKNGYKYAAVPVETILNTGGTFAADLTFIPATGFYTSGTLGSLAATVSSTCPTVAYLRFVMSDIIVQAKNENALKTVINVRRDYRIQDAGGDVIAWTSGSLGEGTKLVMNPSDTVSVAVPGEVVTVGPFNPGDILTLSVRVSFAHDASNPANETTFTGIITQRPYQLEVFGHEQGDLLT